MRIPAYYKIVYQGPCYSGKTTTLRAIHAQMPADCKRAFQIHVTETERIIWFDLTLPPTAFATTVPLQLRLITVPGVAIDYERICAEVLEGADGIVLVADSQSHKIDEAVNSLRHAQACITQQQKSWATFPMVLQYTKRDVPTAAPIDVMDACLNQRQWPRFASIPTRGDGVMDAFNTICRLVVSTTLGPFGKAS